MTSSSLYIGNLPFDTTNDELSGHLDAMGVGGIVKTEIAMKGTRSKGWAIVEFESPDFSMSAMGMLDGSSVGDRQLLVREDRGQSKPSTNGAAGAQQAPREQQPRDDTPTNTLYVGNLPWDVTSEQLAELFSNVEVVSCEVQKRLSGRSKGFGTVEFRSVEDATVSLNLLDGHVLGERTLTVRFDKQAAPVQPTNKVFVGNLPWSVDDDALVGMFEGYAVSSGYVKVVNGRSRGFGIVEFSDMNEAARVIETKGEFEYDGRQIFLRYDKLNA